MAPWENDADALESVTLTGLVPETRCTEPFRVPVKTVSLGPNVQEMTDFFVGTKLTLNDATGDRLLPELKVALPVDELNANEAPGLRADQEWSS